MGQQPTLAHKALLLNLLDRPNNSTYGFTPTGADQIRSRDLTRLNGLIKGKVREELQGLVDRVYQNLELPPPAVPAPQPLPQENGETTAIVTPVSPSPGAPNEPLGSTPT